MVKKRAMQFCRYRTLFEIKRPVNSPLFEEFFLHFLGIGLITSSFSNGMIFLFYPENHCYGRFYEGFIVDRDSVRWRMECFSPYDSYFLSLQSYQSGAGKQV
jgi:hypothetical protein